MPSLSLSPPPPAIGRIRNTTANPSSYGANHREIPGKK
uniref:Uncharacterized protein n=1 Tax=Arundo donax TaxID=35708 RepID=A0A0A9E3Q5_ARUDO